MRLFCSMYFFSTLFILLHTSSLFSDELLVIQSVANSKKKFLTRNGKDKGIAVGNEATFISDDFSIVAVAKVVTRNLTLWQIKKNGAMVPFKKGDLVNFTPSSEKIWTSTKESLKENIDKNLQAYFLSEKNKIDQDLEYYNLYENKQVEKIKLESNKDDIDKNLKNYFTLRKLDQDSTLVRKKIELTKIINEMKPTHSLNLMLHYNQGLSEQVSFVDPANQSTKRFGYQVNLTYQYQLYGTIFLETGVRLEQEENVLTQFVIVSNRQYINFGLNYYFNIPNRETPWAIYTGVGGGIGKAKTIINNETVLGEARIFPHLKIGTEYFLKNRWSILLEGGYESILIQDAMNDGQYQDTHQDNFTMGIGLKRYISF